MQTERGKRGALLHGFDDALFQGQAKGHTVYRYATRVEAHGVVDSSCVRR